jgi:hypothetical protein
MHHSKLPLTAWFWAAYLMATHVESRSSWLPEAAMFVICSNTNSPPRLQHFVVPDAEG